MPEVICLGETMALVAPAEPEPLGRADLLRLDIAGAESTVALYLADLGRAAAWVSRLGDDPFGDRVLGTLDRNRVDTHWVVRDPSAPTGVFFKDPGPHGTRVFYYRKGSAASRMSPDTVAAVPLEQARVVHLSGITPGLSATCHDLVDSVLDRLAGSGTLASFDVNYRSGVWTVDEAAPVLLGLARRAGLVLVGRDEAQTLWGTDSAEDVRELIGPTGTLVVKDGAIGATEIAGDRDPVFVPAPPVAVVEPVGAGDAFAAGYLTGLLADDPPAARLERGHRVAARAMSGTGDFIASPGVAER